MSRIGKKPITIASGVEAKISGDSTRGFVVAIKGPKGSLQVSLPPRVNVVLEGQNLLFSVASPDNKDEKALWGLSRTLVNNAIIGVTKGYSKELEINGVGFKVVLQGKKLILNVGFSHPVEYALPAGISAELDKNRIKIQGIDKQSVGQTAAEIRAIKKPEPYKGKGIKYLDEQIRRKAGKVVKAG